MSTSRKYITVSEPVHRVMLLKSAVLGRTIKECADEAIALWLGLSADDIKNINKDIRDAQLKTDKDKQ